LKHLKNKKAMGYYLNLVNHERKIICEACKDGKPNQTLPAYFDSEEQKELVPKFLEYCKTHNLKIEIFHDLSVDSGELYQNGYEDFKDIISG